MTDRPHCQNRSACIAKGRGRHCIPCTAQDPAVRARKSASIRATLQANPEKMEARIELAKRLSRDKAIIERRTEKCAATRADPAFAARHAAACAAAKAERMKDPAFLEKLREAGRRVGATNIAHTRAPEVRARAGASIRARHLAWCPPEYWDLNAKLKGQGFRLPERKEIILAEVERNSPAAVALREARDQIARITHEMHVKAERQKAQAY